MQWFGKNFLQSMGKNSLTARVGILATGNVSKIMSRATVKIRK